LNEELRRVESKRTAERHIDDALCQHAEPLDRFRESANLSSWTTVLNEPAPHASLEDFGEPIRD
jgi:hypothetical protein